jgi:hypothetical protein
MNKQVHVRTGTGKSIIRPHYFHLGGNLSPEKKRYDDEIED